MNLIPTITNSAKQKQGILLPNGETVTITMEFKPLQTGWFMGVVHQDFSMASLRVVTSPNMLHQFKNLIPFGLAVFVDGDQEPLFQDDFSSGRAKLYLLSQDEVDDFEALLGSG